MKGGEFPLEFDRTITRLSGEDKFRQSIKGMIVCGTNIIFLSAIRRKKSL